MRNPLDDLIRISRAVGKDASLVRGGGGNTSMKTADGRYMYIKASGAALKDMGGRKGWRRLRLGSALAILDDGSLARRPPQKREAEVAARLLLACEGSGEKGARPSVESLLHALLGRCVVHLHPVAVGALVCAGNGRAEVARLFSSGDASALWVPYADPGYKLARRIARLIRAGACRAGNPCVLFLEKHGLLVTADTPHRALALVRRAVAVCDIRVGRPGAARARAADPREVAALKRAIRGAYAETAGERVTVEHSAGREVGAFLARRDARRLVSTPALMPDELIYANGPPLWLDGGDGAAMSERLKRRMMREGRPVRSFLAPGIGLFVAGRREAIPLIREVAVASLSIRAGAARLGGLNPLNRRQREFIAGIEGAAGRA